MIGVKDIRNRIKGVSETAQITRAMELVSASKMQKASLRYNNSLAYFQKIRPVVLSIASEIRFAESHRYLKKTAGKRGFLVIGSEKGLSGDYNHNVVSYTLQQTTLDDDIYCVGEAAAMLFTKREVELLDCANQGKLDDARLLATVLMKAFEEEKYSEISVVYTGIINKARSECRTITLLPILPDGEVEKREYVLEPDQKAVFDVLLPQYVIGTLYECITAAKYTEHLERMRAMNAATENANELLDELRLNYNKARQEKITTELTELYGGLIDY